MTCWVETWASRSGLHYVVTGTERELQRRRNATAEFVGVVPVSVFVCQGYRRSFRVARMANKGGIVFVILRDNGIQRPPSVCFCSIFIVLWE